jgi:hypothetical protein
MNTLRHTRPLLAACALAALTFASQQARAQSPAPKPQVLPVSGLTFTSPVPVEVEKKGRYDVVVRRNGSVPYLSVALTYGDAEGDRGACEKMLEAQARETKGAAWGNARVLVNRSWYDRMLVLETKRTKTAMVCLTDGRQYVRGRVVYGGDFHAADFDDGRAILLALTDAIMGGTSSSGRILHLRASRLMFEEDDDVPVEVGSDGRVDVIARAPGGGPEFVVEVERTPMGSCGDALERSAATWSAEVSPREDRAPANWHDGAVVFATDGPHGYVACVEGEEGRFLATVFYRGSVRSKDYRDNVLGVLGGLGVSVGARELRSARREVFLQPRVNLGDQVLDFEAALGVKVASVPGATFLYQSMPNGLRVSLSGETTLAVLMTRVNIPGNTCATTMEGLARDGKFGQPTDAPYLPPSWHPRALEKIDESGLKASACLQLKPGKGLIFMSVFSDTPSVSTQRFASTFGVLFANVAHAHGVSRGPRRWLAWDDVWP